MSNRYLYHYYAEKRTSDGLTCIDGLLNMGTPIRSMTGYLHAKEIIANDLSVKGTDGLIIKSLTLLETGVEEWPEGYERSNRVITVKGGVIA